MPDSFFCRICGVKRETTVLSLNGVVAMSTAYHSESKGWKPSSADFSPNTTARPKEGRLFRFPHLTGLPPTPPLANFEENAAEPARQDNNSSSASCYMEADSERSSFALFDAAWCSDGTPLGEAESVHSELSNANEGDWQEAAEAVGSDLNDDVFHNAFEEVLATDAATAPLTDEEMRDARGKAQSALMMSLKAEEQTADTSEKKEDSEPVELNAGAVQVRATSPKSVQGLLQEELTDMSTASVQSGQFSSVIDAGGGLAGVGLLKGCAAVVQFDGMRSASNTKAVADISGVWHITEHQLTGGAKLVYELEVDEHGNVTGRAKASVSDTWATTLKGTLVGSQLSWTEFAVQSQSPHHNAQPTSATKAGEFAGFVDEDGQSLSSGAGVLVEGLSVKFGGKKVVIPQASAVSVPAEASAPPEKLLGPSMPPQFAAERERQRLELASLRSENDKLRELLAATGTTSALGTTAGTDSSASNDGQALPPPAVPVQANSHHQDDSKPGSLEELRQKAKTILVSSSNDGGLMEALTPMVEARQKNRQEGDNQKITAEAQRREVEAAHRSAVALLTEAAELQACDAEHAAAEAEKQRSAAEAQQRAEAQRSAAEAAHSAVLQAEARAEKQRAAAEAQREAAQIAHALVMEAESAHLLALEAHKLAAAEAHRTEQKRKWAEAARLVVMDTKKAHVAALEEERLLKLEVARLTTAAANMAEAAKRQAWEAKHAATEAEKQRLGYDEAEAAQQRAAQESKKKQVAAEDVLRESRRGELRKRLVQGYLHGHLSADLAPAFQVQKSFDPIRTQTRNMVGKAASDGSLLEAMKQVFALPSPKVSSSIKNASSVPEAAEKIETCSCGSNFISDSSFCRSCGNRRGGRQPQSGSPKTKQALQQKKLGASAAGKALLRGLETGEVAKLVSEMSADHHIPTQGALDKLERIVTTSLAGYVDDGSIAKALTEAFEPETKPLSVEELRSQARQALTHSLNDGSLHAVIAESRQEVLPKSYQRRFSDDWLTDFFPPDENDNDEHILRDRARDVFITASNNGTLTKIISESSELRTRARDALRMASSSGALQRSLSMKEVVVPPLTAAKIDVQELRNRARDVFVSATNDGSLDVQLAAVSEAKQDLKKPSSGNRSALVLGLADMAEAVISTNAVAAAALALAAAGVANSTPGVNGAAAQESAAAALGAAKAGSAAAVGLTATALSTSRAAIGPKLQ